MMIKLNDLTNTISRNRLFWLLQCCGWFVVGVLGFSFTYIAYSSWGDAFALTLFRTLYGVGATCGLRPLYRRMRRRLVSLPGIGLTTFILCGVIGAIDVLLTLWLGNSLGVDMDGSGRGRFSNLENFFKASLLMRWVLFWFWSVLYFGLNYWLDTQKLGAELAEAEVAAQVSELKALKAQVNPHFLFNALGSILAESENSRAVREITLALSDYLRFSLQQRRELEPLGTELNALENYLRVEQARFEDNFQYKVSADRHALNTPVPTALVQPLLENAIKYGQRTSARPLRIAIDAVVDGESLTVTVRNSGRWVPPESNRSTKTGLANLRRRLELIYGDAASLDINEAAGEVIMEIRLPAASEAVAVPVLKPAAMET